MNLEERTKLLYRILQGKIIQKPYVLYIPTLEILFDSQNYYNEILEEYKYESWMKDIDCEKMLIYNGLYKSDDKQLIKKLYEQIDQNKISLYKSFFNITQREALRREIVSLNDKIDKLDSIRQSLDHFTLCGFARILRQQYIITKTAYFLDGERVFTDFSSSNFNLLQKFYSILVENHISQPQFREIARNEPWTTIWRVSKSNTLNKSGMELTDEQRYLLLYSQMYDNISEHPEEPHQDIVNDDDALDGWFLVQKQKRDKEKNSKNASNVLGIKDDAQEVFLPARNLQEIQQIGQLNDLEGKKIIEERNRKINSLGEVTEAQLPDQQRNIRKQLKEKLGI